MRGATSAEVTIEALEAHEEALKKQMNGLAASDRDIAAAFTGKALERMIEARMWLEEAEKTNE